MSSRIDLAESAGRAWRSINQMVVHPNILSAAREQISEKPLVSITNPAYYEPLRKLAVGMWR
jgi:hypothetical protein